MRTARQTLLALAAVTALALAGCAPAEITPAFVTYTESPPTDKTFAPEPPEDPKPAIAWPITGLDASEASPEELVRPALAIKIPNDSKARPQSNLEYADIVFEHYIDGGIPRLIAVYHSVYPPTVGPIRSMREHDADSIGHLGGPLVFSGANPKVMQVARNTGQLLIAQDLGDDGFFRTKDKPAPYNLHIDIPKIVAQAGDSVAPGPQFNFAYPAQAATAVLQGTDATNIDLRFSGYGEPSWDWDPATNTWLRSEFGEPSSTVAGTRLSATNVLVLHVTVRTSNSLPVSQMIVSGSPGYVATGGKYIPILWTKADRLSAYEITTLEGEPVFLAPGQTWVEFVPNAGVSGTRANFS